MQRQSESILAAERRVQHALPTVRDNEAEEYCLALHIHACCYNIMFVATPASLHILD